MGSGGVGGYFGARLAATGNDVTFIARGAHLEALRSKGLRIESPKGNLHLRQVRAAGRAADAGEVDAVLFAVKMYDTEAAAGEIRPLLGRGAAVVTFQNGVESVAILSRILGVKDVMGGTAYINAVISEPGTIRHTAMDRLIFGEIDGRATPRATALRDACAGAGIDVTLSATIEIDIWEKFVRLAVFSGMCAISRSTIGAIRSDPDLRAMLAAALDETFAVAKASGIPLRPPLMGEIQAMVRDLPADSKASMLEDLERGKPLELPWLSGAVVRIGRETGTPTPIHAFIATALKPLAGGERR
jgi:2-dehydropantoate 2-reductase